MDAGCVLSIFKEATRDNSLSEASFVKAWSAGDLPEVNLRSFGEQFRHFEAILTCFLDDILVKAEDKFTRETIQQNLADERGDISGVSHVQLLDSFVAATGGQLDAPISPAMERLRSLCADFIVRSVADGIAVLLVYELQSPALCATLLDGLVHRGYSEEATFFWKLHSHLDHEHAYRLAQALTLHEDQLPGALSAALEIHAAWHEFFDEQCELAA